MRSHKMTIEAAFENPFLAQSELKEFINKQAEIITPEIEIDSVYEDSLGKVYRVWSGMQFIGKCYQNLEGKWVAQPFSNEKLIFCNTSDLAIAIIVALNELLVVDVA